MTFIIIFHSENILKYLCEETGLVILTEITLHFQTEEGKPIVRVDTQNELGYTPLHQAAQQGHVQIVNLLIENGASPNTVSNVRIIQYLSLFDLSKILTSKITNL